MEQPPVSKETRVAFTELVNMMNNANNPREGGIRPTLTTVQTITKLSEQKKMPGAASLYIATKDFQKKREIRQLAKETQDIFFIKSVINNIDLDVLAMLLHDTALVFDELPEKLQEYLKEEFESLSQDERTKDKKDEIVEQFYGSDAHELGQEFISLVERWVAFVTQTPLNSFYGETFADNIVDIQTTKEEQRSANKALSRIEEILLYLRDLKKIPQEPEDFEYSEAIIRRRREKIPSDVFWRWVAYQFICYVPVYFERLNLLLGEILLLPAARLLDQTGDLVLDPKLFEMVLDSWKITDDSIADQNFGYSSSNDTSKKNNSAPNLAEILTEAKGSYESAVRIIYQHFEKGYQAGMNKLTHDVQKYMLSKLEDEVLWTEEYVPLGSTNISANQTEQVDKETEREQDISLGYSNGENDVKKSHFQFKEFCNFIANSWFSRLSNVFFGSKATSLGESDPSKKYCFFDPLQTKQFTENRDQQNSSVDKSAVKPLLKNTISNFEPFNIPVAANQNKNLICSSSLALQQEFSSSEERLEPKRDNDDDDGKDEQIKFKKGVLSTELSAAIRNYQQAYVMETTLYTMQKKNNKLSRVEKYGCYQLRVFCNMLPTIQALLSEWNGWMYAHMMLAGTLIRENCLALAVEKSDERRFIKNSIERGLAAKLKTHLETINPKFLTSNESENVVQNQRAEYDVYKKRFVEALLGDIYASGANNGQALPEPLNGKASLLELSVKLPLVSDTELGYNVEETVTKNEELEKSEENQKLEDPVGQMLSVSHMYSRLSLDFSYQADSRKLYSAPNLQFVSLDIQSAMNQSRTVMYPLFQLLPKSSASARDPRYSDHVLNRGTGEGSLFGSAKMAVPQLAPVVLFETIDVAFIQLKKILAVNNATRVVLRFPLKEDLNLKDPEQNSPYLCTVDTWTTRVNTLINELNIAVHLFVDAQPKSWSSVNILTRSVSQNTPVPNPYFGHVMALYAFWPLTFYSDALYQQEPFLQKLYPEARQQKKDMEKAERDKEMEKLKQKEEKNLAQQKKIEQYDSGFQNVNTDPRRRNKKK